MKPYEVRDYRNLIRQDAGQGFNVVVQETDLYIHGPARLLNSARELVLTQRGYLESYIARYPGFAGALTPWQAEGMEPPIIRDMIAAGNQTGIGPMAAVAGAIAEKVGQGLLNHTDEIMVENGGDIFIKKNGPVTIGLFAGTSPLSLKIGLKIDGKDHSFAVCTSSGTVGHSLSLGKADAVCVVSPSCALADAAATAIGNRIQRAADIKDAISYGQKIAGITGLTAVVGDRIGAWGDIELVRLFEPPFQIPAKKG